MLISNRVYRRFVSVSMVRKYGVVIKCKISGGIAMQGHGDVVVGQITRIFPFCGVKALYSYKALELKGVDKKK